MSGMSPKKPKLKRPVGPETSGYHGSQKLGLSDCRILLEVSTRIGLGPFWEIECQYLQHSVRPQTNIV